MRLFLGLPLTRNEMTPLVALQEKVKPELAGWRVIPSANWHVTLHFLGEVEVTKVPLLEKWLRSLIIPKLPALKWIGWQPFPSKEAANVVALAAAAPTGWTKWNKVLAEDLLSLGIKVEPRPFLPHLTLFRRKESGPVAPPQTIPALTFDPVQICLYESRLGATGPSYQVRVSKNLAVTKRPLSDQGLW